MIGVQVPPTPLPSDVCFFNEKCLHPVEQTAVPPWTETADQAVVAAAAVGQRRLFIFYFDVCQREEVRANLLREL